MPYRKLNFINPTKTKSWLRLKEKASLIEKKKLKALFKEELDREQKYVIKKDNAFFDYTKTHIDNEILTLFKNLAKEIDLDTQIDMLFQGEKLNTTEKRSVCYMANRSLSSESAKLYSKEIMDEVGINQNKIKTFSKKIHSGELKGIEGKSFNTVVHIGIGGSSLGVEFILNSLSLYQKEKIKIYILTNIEDDFNQNLIKKLDLSRTLFIVVSKSFKTQETLSNYHFFKNIFEKKYGENSFKNNLVVVSNQQELIKKGEVLEGNFFPIFVWEGGRFSTWGSVGLTLSLSLGYENYLKILEGAEKVDLEIKEKKMGYKSFFSNGNNWDLVR